MLRTRTSSDNLWIKEVIRFADMPISETCAHFGRSPHECCGCMCMKLRPASCRAIALMDMCGLLETYKEALNA